jgi:uncharacterized membrane protein
VSDHVDVETVAVDAEDKTLPVVSYVLYLLAFATVVTMFVGLIIAYSNRDTAGAKMRSHYDFQINTFWMAIGWYVLAGALFLIGAPLSFVLIGIPIMIAAALLACAVSVWFAVRCGLGLLYLSRDEAYPRPMAWLF